MRQNQDPGAGELVANTLCSSANAILASHAIGSQIVLAAELLATAFDSGHKLLVCGNGGSAADAQHLASELTGRFVERGPRPTIALTADSAVLTGIANDYAFEEVFAHQVRGLAQHGDVVMAISTSGSSPSVVRALEAAPSGVVKIALCGPLGPLAGLADLALCVPFEGTAAIQSAHIAIIHAICLVLETCFAAPRS